MKTSLLLSYSFFLTVALLCAPARAQDFTKPKRIEINYWVALQEEVSYTLIRDPKGDYTLSTSALGRDIGVDVTLPLATIPAKSLDRLLHLFNDPHSRQSFLKTPLVEEPDGRELSVKLQENTLALTLSTQTGFNEKEGGTVDQRKLVEAVAALLSPAGRKLTADFTWLDSSIDNGELQATGTHNILNSILRLQDPYQHFLKAAVYVLSDCLKDKSVQIPIKDTDCRHLLAAICQQTQVEMFESRGIVVLGPPAEITRFKENFLKYPAAYLGHIHPAEFIERTVFFEAPLEEATVFLNKKLADNGVQDLTLKCQSHQDHLTNFSGTHYNILDLLSVIAADVGTPARELFSD